MHTFAGKFLGFAFLTTLLACGAHVGPATLKVESDAQRQFTLRVAPGVPCGVTVSYSTKNGPQDQTLEAGTSRVLNGALPFYVLDKFGIPHPVNGDIGCFHKVPVTKTCTVDVCYDRDSTGGPIISFQVPTDVAGSVPWRK
ncbi:MAG TPA: hypothetical protein VHI13_01930 [Candidatus Kapabacteria bacterium]|nr:hypothetical protein [Candidatus Kapabacteria bacterium]